MGFFDKMKQDAQIRKVESEARKHRQESDRHAKEMRQLAKDREKARVEAAKQQLLMERLARKQKLENQTAATREATIARKRAEAELSQYHPLARFFPNKGTPVKPLKLTMNKPTKKKVTKRKVAKSPRATSPKISTTKGRGYKSMMFGEDWS
jgi:hypothetical protein